MNYDLLIVFTDGKMKVVKRVKNYGIDYDSGCFWFIKNDYRSFVNKDSVAFFGRRFDFEEMY